MVGSPREAAGGRKNCIATRVMLPCSAEWVTNASKLPGLAMQSPPLAARCIACRQGAERRRPARPTHRHLGSRQLPRTYSRQGDGWPHVQLSLDHRRRI